MKNLRIALLSSVLLTFCLAAVAHAAPQVWINGPESASANKNVVVKFMAKDSAGLAAIAYSMDNGRTKLMQVRGMEYAGQMTFNTGAKGVRLLKVRAKSVNGQWSRWSEYRCWVKPDLTKAKPRVINNRVPVMPGIPRYNVELTGPETIVKGQPAEFRYTITADPAVERIVIMNPFLGRPVIRNQSGSRISGSFHLDTSSGMFGRVYRVGIAPFINGRAQPYTYRAIRITMPAPSMTTISFAGEQSVVVGQPLQVGVRVTSTQNMRAAQVFDSRGNRRYSVQLHGRFGNFRAVLQPSPNDRPGNHVLRVRVQTADNQWSNWREFRYTVTEMPPLVISAAFVGPNTVRQNGMLAFELRIWSDESPLVEVEVIDPFTHRPQTYRRSAQTGHIIPVRYHANVPPGNYTFRFRAKGANGRWSDYHERPINVYP